MADFLLGDIGGTNTRLAVVPAGSIAHRHARSYRNDDFACFEDIVRTYLDELGRAGSGMPTSGGVLAVAGPVNGPVVDLSNSPWRIDGTAVSAVLDGAPVRLMNDFEALAQALPYLDKTDLMPLNDVPRDPQGLHLVLGPGTGLGVAALVDTPTGEWRVIASEGGHARLTVAGAAERRLLERFEAELGYVAIEDAVSGPGLVRIYRATASLADAPPLHDDPAAITEAATGGDALADRSVRQFVVWLARAACNLALTFLPRGGLFIGGGIAPQIHNWLAGDVFRSSYRDAGSQSDLVASFPLAIVCADQPALTGTAVTAMQDLQGGRGS